VGLVAVINNLKIPSKLMMAFGALVLTICAVILGVFLKLTAAEQAGATTGRMTEILDLSNQAQIAMLEQSGAIRGLLLSKEARYGDNYRAEKSTFEGVAQKMRGLVKNPDVKALLEQSLAAAKEWHSRVGDIQVQVATNPNAMEQANEIMRSGLNASLYRAYRETNDRMEQAQRKLLAEVRAADTAAQDAVKTVLMIGGLVALLIAIGFGLLLARTIGAPITAMTKVMNQFAAGDYQAAIPGAGRRDEIGEMAKAVEVFKQGGLDRIRMEHEADEQRGLTEEERTRNEKARAASAKEQAIVVANIGRGLDALAKGDLTFRISENFPGEYKKLQDDFNAAMGTLQETMKTISGATEGIRSGTGEVSQAADDLSKRTEQQAASLEETAAALDEITATVRKTAEGANHARDAVTTAKSDAERSGEVVGGAVQAMSAIEQSAKQISNIIGVIDEIAFQTNLLALNAGVEAARAGEAGKGFAVVASEVRALAQRSADAAKEIKTLIQASSTQVASGVDLVGQAGKALERIVVQIAEINAVVTEIAASAKEQATGLAEVNTAVNQMDQVTQQNAAMVEQSTAASHSLAQEADELGRLISRFEVGAGATVTPMAKRAAPAQRTVTAMKTTGGRGASAMRKPEPAEEGWEEF
jgi:methyl-accepting chemotaxis protein